MAPTSYTIISTDMYYNAFEGGRLDTRRTLFGEHEVLLRVLGHLFAIRPVAAWLSGHLVTATPWRWGHTFQNSSCCLLSCHDSPVDSRILMLGSQENETNLPPPTFRYAPFLSTILFLTSHPLPLLPNQSTFPPASLLNLVPCLAMSGHP